MNTKDKHYLTLQFRDKVFYKNGSEYQTFFENIMERGVLGFQKIRSYGNLGDGGNDGYVPSTGEYYQVYAPKKPSDKDSAAANKMVDDFYKVLEKWDDITPIKAYKFVFNDKYAGSTIVLEKALSSLRKDYPNITFSIFAAKHLEDIFMQLQQEDMLMLGFDIDSTKVITMANALLERMEDEFDKDNSTFIEVALSNYEEIVRQLNHNDLLISYEILKARCFVRLERVDEGKSLYKELILRYPNDPRAHLYLAELYLDENDYDNNQACLDRAEIISKDNSTLKLQRILRNLRLNMIDQIEEFDESKIPTDSRILSNYCRLYSIISEWKGEFARADWFIDRAINLNPIRIHNYLAKLEILEHRTFLKILDSDFIPNIELYLQRLDETIIIIKSNCLLNKRNQLIINLKYLIVYRVLDKYHEIERILEESSNIIIQCYYNYLIDKLIVEMYAFIEMPNVVFNKLLDYLRPHRKIMSNALAQRIFLEFCYKGTLITDGKTFFCIEELEEIRNLILKIEREEYDQAVECILADVNFSYQLAASAKNMSELRSRLIERLQDDSQKILLQLFFYFDEQDFTKAFEYLKHLDLTNINYKHCKPLLVVALENQAWEYVVMLASKLLLYEAQTKIIVELKLHLFNAQMMLKNYKEMIIIGKDLIDNDTLFSSLSDVNKEILFSQTIIAMMSRLDFSEAKTFMEEHKHLSITAIFKIEVETNVYIENNEAINALKSIEEGIRLIKTPTPEQYGSLYFPFIKISKMIEFQPNPLVQVSKEVFVKLEGEDRWFFIGEDCELDASKITQESYMYNEFMNRKVGDSIIFKDKYNPTNKQHKIENILSIQKYILWKCLFHAHKLTEEQRWDTMRQIAVPIHADIPDMQYMKAFMEDTNKNIKGFFEVYCKGFIPLAMLATYMGGIEQAIGLIQNEAQGFININSGDQKGMDQQIIVANDIINGESFYIDATSAMLLSEAGLLVKIYQHIPNIKVPQSVILFLYNLANKFRYSISQTGYLSSIKGKLIFSEVSQSRREIIQKELLDSISLLESKQEAIVSISDASKIDCASEKKVLPELCDACILAQKDDAILLTEDYIYIEWNKNETKKEPPKFCSSFALLKVLLKQNKISFDEYLNYFGRLASYRCRFLSISIDDLELAVLGEGKIKVVRPTRLKQFNLSLTFSAEYGVQPIMAIKIIAQFLQNILLDDSISSTKTEEIFLEIIQVLPVNISKRSLGKMLITLCHNLIVSDHKIIGKHTNNKIAELDKTIDLLNEQRQIWTPN